MRWDASEPAAGFSTTAPWQALSDDPVSVNVADQTGDPGSLLSTYRDLIRLRASQPALASGALVPVDAADRHVVAWLRTEGPETALVVANVGNEAVSAPLLSLAEGPLCGAPQPVVRWGARDAEVAAPSITPSGGFEDYAPVWALGPREAVVISLEP
jgi:Domain of unknown function (DUF3459)